MNFETDSEFRLRWATTVGSPVYSTPVLFPNALDGSKQIFVSTFYQYAELLDKDGFKSWGWPLSFEDSSFQGSPMVYDVDGDGNIDMGVVDKNGNMFWVRIGEFGEYLEDYHVQVPKLRVKRDWSEGLDPQFVDSYVKLSMFDRSGAAESAAAAAGGGNAPSNNKKAKLDDLQSLGPIKSAPASSSHKAPSPSSKEQTGSAQRRRLSEDSSPTEPEGNQGQGVGESGGGGVPDFGEGAVDDFIANEAERLEAIRGDFYGAGAGLEADRGAADASLEDILGGEVHTAPPPEGEGIGSNAGEEEGAAGAIDGNAYEAEYAYRAPPGRTRGGHGAGYGAGGAYYAGAGGMLGGVNQSEYVLVDAHVLASPVLADINGDGHMEVLVSVSYYFDKAEYAGKGVEQLGFDPDLFVAGGVACWDLEEQRWTWLVHLDLTTAKSKFQAMIYAPPTVADLDGDGRKEVIVGTALGLLYVMDGESGFVRRFFPMQFNSIQAAVSVADVAGDRDLEMIVLDMGGTVAVVNLKGDILWDAHLSGTLPFPATVGDVDGDGQVDVVVVAATEGKGSHIYALRGDTGAVLPGYPIALPNNAAVSSPVLLVDLLNTGHHPPSVARHNAAAVSNASEKAKMRRPLNLGAADDPFFVDMLLSKDDLEAIQLNSFPLVNSRKGLHVVVSCFEGSVYIIDATTPEVPGPLDEGQAVRKFHAQRIDVGEHVYCLPLLDDVTGDGFLDLLVGTLNGQLLLFESSIPATPRNSWTSFPNHRLNSVTHGQMGVSIPYEEKERMELLDIKGSRNLSVVFEIWDRRYEQALAAGAKVSEGGEGSSSSGSSSHMHLEVEYTVSITRGTNRLQPLWSRTFNKPGKYVAFVPVSPPEIALLVLSMSSDHGEYFEDTVHVTLSTKFYIWLKYLLVTPLVILCFTILSRYRRKV
uniref:DEX1 C-terminal domain-containing protein n=1 Tax=Spumella elongata TaxID=89044 RepID=A0A7S3HBI1_9STRA